MAGADRPDDRRHRRLLRRPAARAAAPGSPPRPCPRKLHRWPCRCRAQGRRAGGAPDMGGAAPARRRSALPRKPRSMASKPSIGGKASSNPSASPNWREPLKPNLLAILLAALLLSANGCAMRSMPSGASALVKPRPAAVPQALKLPCSPPVELPDRALGGTETVRLWGKDRAALGACATRQAALANATGELERQGQ